MNRFLILLVLALSLGTLVGCGFVPPKEMEQVPFLEFMQNWTEEYTEITYAIWRGEEGALAHKADVLDTFTSKPKVIVFSEGDRFTINRTPIYSGPNSPPADYANAFLFGFLDTPKLTTSRRLAMTYDGDRKALISLDGRRWYDSTGVDPDAWETTAATAFKEWITFTPVLDRPGRLEVDMKWAAALEPINPPVYWQWDTDERPILNYGPGMVLTSPQRREINADMRRNVVWFPADGEMQLTFRIEGNLLNGVATPDTFEVSVLRDFWMYIRSPSNVSISFDGSDWFNMFWDFEIKNETFARSIDADTLESEVLVVLRYKGRK